MSWRIYIDQNGDGLTTDVDEVTGRTIECNWKLGMNEQGQRMANESVATIIMNNADYSLSPERGGGITVNRAVAIEYESGGETTRMWAGYVTTIRVENRFSKRLVVSCSGVMQWLTSAKVRMALMENVSADEVLNELLDDVLFPNAAGWRFDVSRFGVDTYFGGNNVVRDFESGVQNFPLIGDSFGESMSIYDAMFQMVQGERGRLWFTRSNAVKFVNKNYEKLLPDAVDTFSDEFATIDYSWGSTIANEVRVVCAPRSISAGNVDLWTLDDTLTLEASESETIRGRFASGNDAEVIGGKDLVTPNTGDGSLVATGSVSVGMVGDARGATLTVTNSTGGPVDITTLTVRGKKISTNNRYEVVEVDGSSVNNFGRKVLMIDTSVMPSASEARLIAEFELKVRKDPRAVVRAVGFKVKSGTALMTRLVGVVIGDAVGIVDTPSGHDGEHMVIGESWQLSGDGLQSATVNWVLEPVRRQAYWRFDISRFGVDTYFA